MYVLIARCSTQLIPSGFMRVFSFCGAGVQDRLHEAISADGDPLTIPLQVRTLSFCPPSLSTGDEDALALPHGDALTIPPRDAHTTTLTISW